MFNIPMNTKGALSADNLTSLNNNVRTVPQQAQNTQPMAQPQYTQQPMVQQQYTQQQPMVQQQYTQQQPMVQSQYPQQPITQPPQAAQPVVLKQRPVGTGVHLKKGQKTSLSQMNPSLSNIQVCLGWDISNQACDLDVSAFMLRDNNKVVGDDWFVFYGQTVSPDGSIVHQGDSYDGSAVGDDEIIDIKLNQINPMVKKIAFVITINEARERNLNFSMVSNAYVRVVDKSNGKELVKFLLTDYFSNVTSMVVGEVYNKGGQWRFNPVGNGFAEDLAGLCNIYGVNVAD